MVCLCCLWVVVTVVFVPGFESVCWDSSICNDLSDRGRILDCVQHCISAIQSENPEIDAVKVTDEDDLMLNILLAILATEDIMLESDLKGHNDERRSYSMEHFRWGKPSGGKTQEPKLKAHSDERRSYSMEHFRWGKPSGRKRRPVKVFASSLEGGGSSEGSFLPRARRQLGTMEDNAKKNPNGRQQTPGSQRVRTGSKSHVPLSLQERKEGAYRMSHFRWGSPPASKRNGSFMKPWEEKPQGQLAKFFRNIIVRDVQRIMG